MVESFGLNHKYKIRNMGTHTFFRKFGLLGKINGAVLVRDGRAVLESHGLLDLEVLLFSGTFLSNDQNRQ